MKLSASKIGPLHAVLPDFAHYLETGELPRPGGWDEQDAIFKRRALELKGVRDKPAEAEPGGGRDRARR